MRLVKVESPWKEALLARVRFRKVSHGMLLVELWMTTQYRSFYKS